MDVIIQSLGFKAGADLESFVREKLQKLDGKSDNIINAEVTLFIGSERDPNNNFCEIRLGVPGNDHFVKKGAATFELAIVDAVNTIQEQLVKAKAKMSDRRP